MKTSNLAAIFLCSLSSVTAVKAQTSSSLAAQTSVAPTQSQTRVVPQPERPKLAISATLGLGSPLGAGAEIDTFFTESLGLGVGVGMDNGGPQVAAMARFRLGNFGAGVGGSFGNYEATYLKLISNDDTSNDYGRAAWVNGEIFAETQGRPIFHRFTVGAGMRVYQEQCRHINVSGGSGFFSGPDENRPCTPEENDFRRFVPSLAYSFGVRF